MEGQVPVAQRRQFMDTVYWHNSMYGPIDGNADYTHVFDMNADGATDYVYSGPGPGFDTKEMIAVFKINNMAFSVLGSLKSMDFESRVLKRLYFERTIETDSANVTQQISYEIDYNNKKPTLRKFFQSEMSDTTELPTSLYEKYPVRTFCSDSIIFSSRPQAIDATHSQFITTRRGLVLGEKIDSNNKKWLFIAITSTGEAMGSGDNIYQVGWTPETRRNDRKILAQALEMERDQ
ncbi:hypothetical protein KK062_26635 [Fulvivirgaceae bacterium PWU5]|uniref:Uncharacterized protein n=1 Tax=Dawidia cretensis TaxID=2782350 RepID=A0AAP2E509_9BACT|nr:hypothetical protein [Dawidia cretensis]MBT1711847.1 hypothetical protein [Dawidia cretensis]